MGGNYRGRYLNDSWRLDVETMAWSPVPLRHLSADDKTSGSGSGSAAEAAEPDGDGATGAEEAASGSQGGAAPAAAATPSVMPPIAGHSATPWKDDHLVLIGGHCKPKDAPSSLPVRLVDVKNGTLASFAAYPAAGERGGV